MERMISCFVFFTKYYEVIHINEDGMGATCSLHAGDDKCIQNFTKET